MGGYADAAQEPEWFTTAPSLAVPKAIAKAGITPDQVDFYELNEAFSVVGLANMKELGIDSSNTNVNGGAVSLGHPLGCSGARIIVTLINVLEQNNAKIDNKAIVLNKKKDSDFDRDANILVTNLPKDLD